MSNVRPGDRAIVVKANIRENLGKIVEVIEPCLPGHRLPGPGFFVMGVLRGEVAWVVEALSGALIMRHPTVGERRHPVAACLDHMLRRLPRPDEMPSEEVQAPAGASLLAPCEDSQTV